MSKIIEVVGALVRDGGKTMLAQRPQGKAQAGFWEFPGGKLEPGETVEQALVRELREELALEIENPRVIGSVVHEYPEKTIHLTLVECNRAADSIPCPQEHQAVDWFDSESIKSISICPADVELIKRLGIHI